METGWLFLIFLRASLLSFSGQAALPLVRDDLVSRGLATDQQLVEALTIGRLGTGPGGLYLVAIGFFAMGLAGALAAAAALTIPPLLVIPLAGFLRPRLASPAVNGLIRGVALSTSSLVVVTSVDLLASEAGGVPAPWQLLILAASVAIGIHGRLHPAWIIGAAAAVAMVILGPLS